MAVMYKSGHVQRCVPFAIQPRSAALAMVTALVCTKSGTRSRNRDHQGSKHEHPALARVHAVELHSSLNELMQNQVRCTGDARCIHVVQGCMRRRLMRDDAHGYMRMCEDACDAA